MRISADNIFPKLVLLFLIISFSRVAAEEKRRELPFKDGESLTYVLSYTWGGVNTDVGEGVATLKYDNGIYNALVTGHTYKFYDLFFKVREHFESNFDETTMRPLSFYRNTLEGKYRMVNEYKFDNESYTIEATTRKRDDQPKDSLLQGTAETYDLVTLFYLCRSIDFNNVPIGEKQPISFAIDREIYNLYFIFKGREVKKIKGLGTHNTLKFAVRLVAGEVFTGEDELIVWISDDANKIPLIFESEVLVGTVYGRLKKWENLKYPLGSIVKRGGKREK